MNMTSSLLEELHLKKYDLEEELSYVGHEIQDEIRRIMKEDIGISSKCLSYQKNKLVLYSGKEKK